MSLLIKNATVLTISGQKWDKGFVCVRHGVIAEAGPGEPGRHLYSDIEQLVIDAEGLYLMPGLIDAHCHVGLFDDGLGSEGQDGNEATDPITPQLQAMDGIFQDDRGFTEACRYGITSVMTGPGSANVIAGHFAFLRTTGRTVDKMARKPMAAMKAAFGENPKKVYGNQSKTPSTRMATASMLRDALKQASDYMQAVEDARQDENKKKPDYNGRWEALVPVLKGEMILKIHAHRTDDILTAVRIANQYGLRYSLDHCTEGYLIADILAEEYEKGKHEDCGKGKPGQGRLIGVVTGPLLSDRSKPELNRSDIANPSILSAAGLPVSIMTDHPVIPIQYLPVSAAVAMREGMSEDSALKSITLNAAAVCDMDDQLGSIEVGKIADLVIFSGHPLNFMSRPETVIIDGQIVYQADQS